jgi:tetratricopeptide (TPR) repeat protein
MNDRPMDGNNMPAEIDFGNARAFAYGNLAEIAIERERWVEARTLLEQKLRLSSQLGFGILIADGQYRLAEVLKRMGQAELALPPAREAYAAYQQLKPGSAPAAKRLLDSLQS